MNFLSAFRVRRSIAVLLAGCATEALAGKDCKRRLAPHLLSLSFFQCSILHPRLHVCHVRYLSLSLSLIVPLIGTSDLNSHGGGLQIEAGPHKNA